ncbi:hypothetical protein L6452_18032 [Arctium lappa]|uniref:Uncharacterized protein n=1 Tax=Arctium lappa TaxID=4217 RepID=A0ACB9C4Y2_ARCLA|nr:hypothetical protein L6452_18032 [Arctium lappa]
MSLRIIHEECFEKRVTGFIEDQKTRGEYFIISSSLDCRLWTELGLCLRNTAASILQPKGEDPNQIKSNQK